MKSIKLSTRIFMGISGACGFAFFLFAHQWFFHVALAPLKAAYIQFGINTFVFTFWGKGYLEYRGKGRWMFLIFALVPVVMATLTFIRVVLPVLLAN
jgi:hypothetical protein